ncbi:hypothetical protein K490DRAFT_67334, partial [Saccharata proteae CBS 121410]
MDSQVPWKSPDSRFAPFPHQQQSEISTDFSKMGAGKNAARKARKANRQAAIQQQRLAQTQYSSQSLKRSQTPRAIKSEIAAKLQAHNVEQADPTTEDLGASDGKQEGLKQRRESFVGNTLLDALENIDGARTAAPMSAKAPSFGKRAQPQAGPFQRQTSATPKSHESSLAPDDEPTPWAVRHDSDGSKSLTWLDYAGPQLAGGVATPTPPWVSTAPRATPPMTQNQTPQPHGAVPWGTSNTPSLPP